MTHMGVETSEIKLLDRIKQLPIGFIPPGASEDLYALAVTVIMLLTGKDIDVLFNSQTQTWDWENWKLVSDQLASVLNQMLAVQAMNRFESAEAVLQALSSSTPFIPVPLPPPPKETPTYIQQPTWGGRHTPCKPCNV